MACRGLRGARRLEIALLSDHRMVSKRFEAVLLWCSGPSGKSPYWDTKNLENFVICTAKCPNYPN